MQSYNILKTWQGRITPDQSGERRMPTERDWGMEDRGGEELTNGECH